MNSMCVAVLYSSLQNHFKSKLNLKALDNILTAMKLAIDKDLKETKF